MEMGFKKMVIVYVFPRAAGILSLSYSLIGLFTYLFTFLF